MTVKTRMLLTLGALLATLLFGSVAASTSLAGEPWWHLISGSNPTYLQPGVEGQIVLTAANLGDADINGLNAPVRIADTLPAGLKAVSILGTVGRNGSDGTGKCDLKSLTCTFAGTIPPYDQIEVLIRVEVEEDAISGEDNEMSVSGGGARSSS